MVQLTVNCEVSGDNLLPAYFYGCYITCQPRGNFYLLYISQIQYVTKSIKSVLLFDCQDTVKYRLPGYFLNMEYWYKICHTTQHQVSQPPHLLSSLPCFSVPNATKVASSTGISGHSDTIYYQGQWKHFWHSSSQ